MELEKEDDELDMRKSFVEEKKELEQLLKGLNVEELEAQIFSKRSKRFCEIISKYQSQPQLLDSLLEQLVSVPMREFRKFSHTPTLRVTHSMHLPSLSKMVYTLAKVRGTKTVEKFFPHEVFDMENTLSFLEQQKLEDYELWECRYVLLLWLSVLVLIPFNLSTMDSSEKGQSSLVEKLIQISKVYLGDSGICRDAASTLISRLLTRPDYSASRLVEFLQWSSEILSKNTSVESTYIRLGVLHALANIFARGKRQELLDKISIIVEHLKKQEFCSLPSILDRKLHIKVLQRLALTYLKPKLAPWRYQRGTRSLFVSDNKMISPLNHSFEENENQKENEEEDVPIEIDELVETLLQGLRDSDTVVRWSAAKGIGRLTGRLPQQFANDIIEFLLDLFSFGESEDAWHGGCLALAELARRGLLLPSQLTTVIPLVLQALQYDERKGTHSVGAHVRDAACYVCWAFARAYSPEVLKSHIQQLASALVVTTVFDREVNCRRAASAAFQENTGRQGTIVPHGIEIINFADYFTLANRSDSFLKISIEIAKFSEYRDSLIEHLLERKIDHWDKSIRELCSKTLSLLAKLDPKHFHDSILPKLIAQTCSEDLFERHGSLLAVAEILLSLSSNQFPLSSLRIDSLLEIIPNLEARRLYRGKGGEIIRQAACRLIECIALSKIPVSGPPKNSTHKPTKSIGMIMQSALDENLNHSNEEIQLAAIAALHSFSRNCYTQNPPKKAAYDMVMRYVTTVLKDDNAAARRGFSLALGVFPKPFYTESIAENPPLLVAVVDALIHSMKIEENPEQRDPETRRNAVHAIARLAETVNSHLFDSHELFSRLCEALFKSLDDYSTEKRGDVGSWVREAALISLEKIFLLIGSNVKDENIRFFFLKTIQCSFDKIDRLRTCAGQLLVRLIHSQPSLQHRESLIQWFPSENHIKWTNSNEAFGLLLQLLELESYRQAVLVGVLPSIGGMASVIVLEHPNPFVEYFKQQNKKKHLVHIGNVAQELLLVFSHHKGNDRIILPLIKTFGQLFANNCLPLNALPPTFGSLLHSALTSELSGCKDILKLLTSVNLLCWCLLFDQPARGAVFSTLMTLLCSSFPRVRKLVSSELYTRLLIDDTILSNPSVTEKVMTLLSTTQWDEKMSQTLKQTRDTIAQLVKQ